MCACACAGAVHVLCAYVCVCVLQLEQELSNPASSLTAAGAYDDVVEVLHNPGIRWASGVWGFLGVRTALPGFWAAP
jgi:hypothetical protein